MKKTNIILLAFALAVTLFVEQAFSDTDIHAGAASYHVVPGHENDYTICIH